MEETKKRTAVLCGSVVCIAAVTFLAGAVRYIGAPWLRITALVAANLLNGLTALAAMRLTGMKIDIDLKNWRQYFTGAALALSLSLVIAVIPALCGVCLVGRHTDFTWGKLVYNLLFYLLIVGPVEEFIFRVYLQDVFVGLFKSSGWLGVIAADALFGLWHMEAFPIDVWMKRALKENFPPDFEPETLGEYAGLAQQYIFYYARSMGREK